MSVLIKGLKMPESCYACDMDGLSGAVWCKHAYDTNNSNRGRALDCPFVELPDHGELIDMDVLRQVLRVSTSCRRCERDTYKCQYYGMTVMNVCEIIDNMPVVIPAERKGEEDV